MKTLLVLLLVCSPVFAREQVEKGSQQIEDFTLHIRIVKDAREECKKRLKEAGVMLEESVHGCVVAGYRNGSEVEECFVFIETPRRVDDDNMATLGHEVWHCSRGDFH